MATAVGAAVHAGTTVTVRAAHLRADANQLSQRERLTAACNTHDTSQHSRLQHAGHVTTQQATARRIRHNTAGYSTQDTSQHSKLQHAGHVTTQQAATRRTRHNTAVYSTQDTSQHSMLQHAGHVTTQHAAARRTRHNTAGCSKQDKVTTQQDAASRIRSQHSRMQHVGQRHKTESQHRHHSYHEQP